MLILSCARVSDRRSLLQEMSGYLQLRSTYTCATHAPYIRAFPTRTSNRLQCMPLPVPNPSCAATYRLNIPSGEGTAAVDVYAPSSHMVSQAGTACPCMKHCRTRGFLYALSNAPFPRMAPKGSMGRLIYNTISRMAIGQQYNDGGTHQPLDAEESVKEGTKVCSVDLLVT